MRFDDRYAESITLRNGTPVQLRLVRPEDKPLLLEGFDHLSPASRYRRFFSAKNRLSERELRYLTELDGVNHLAIGAVDPGGMRGLGVARFVRLKDAPDVAEAAVAVRDELHGQGLGRILLERLAAAARERGIRHFRSEILASNAQIRALLDTIAPGASRTQAGDIVIIDHELAPETLRGGTLDRLLIERARGTLPVVGEE
jgi:GNAT superfamily N-acetyltransferase